MLLVKVELSREADRSGREKMSGRRSTEGEKWEGTDKSKMQFPKTSIFIPVLLPVVRVHPDS